MYKVNYHRLALMADGHRGNILQTRGVVYTDLDVSVIFPSLEKMLSIKKLYPVIENIALIDGEII